VIGAELHRIASHLTTAGALSMELGGFASFHYAIEARDIITDRITELTGARLTTSFGRIGGVNRDLPDGWIEKTEKTLVKIEEFAAEIDTLLTRNRIFTDRTKGTGIITKEDALSFGFTGPCLRACGIDYDLRKKKPYWVYDQLDFKTAVGHNGDNFDRYYMRIIEMAESIKMIRQCLKQIPAGPVIIDDWRIALPPKEDVYGSIEGVIAHFKLVMEGVPVPAGEIYSATESANGELGWYIRSDGSGRPYKLHVRAPGYQLLAGLAHMCEGKMLADLIPTLDRINMIGGEVEQ
jgi:NADH-quinone oxidoreductase subunit D